MLIKTLTLQSQKFVSISQNFIYESMNLYAHRLSFINNGLLNGEVYTSGHIIAEYLDISEIHFYSGKV